MVDNSTQKCRMALTSPVEWENNFQKGKNKLSYN